MALEMIVSEGQHWYPSKKTDIYYPSVTTILSVYPKGIGFSKYLTSQDSWESSQEILNNAGKRGTNVHKATETLEKGEVLVRPTFTLEEWEMLIGYVTWRSQYPQKIILEVEYEVISDKLKTGGTIDRVFKNTIDDSIEIVDIKTSSAIHGNYWVQVAVYATMYEQKHKVIVNEVSILRLAPRKKSGFEYKTLQRDEWLQLIPIFKSTQAIWNHMNPNAGPRILEIPHTLNLSNDLLQHNRLSPDSNQ